MTSLEGLGLWDPTHRWGWRASSYQRHILIPWISPEKSCVVPAEKNERSDSDMAQISDVTPPPKLVFFWLTCTQTLGHWRQPGRAGAGWSGCPCCCCSCRSCACWCGQGSETLISLPVGWTGPPHPCHRNLVPFSEKLGKEHQRKGLRYCISWVRCEWCLMETKLQITLFFGMCWLRRYTGMYIEIGAEWENEGAQAGRQAWKCTDLQAICLHALGMAHSMTVKAQAARMENRQRYSTPSTPS